MPRALRSIVIDEDSVGTYHCIQRCVRRSFLCGEDSVSGKSYEHRKRWIQERLKFLAEVFGVEVLAFAIMSNHIHLVLRNRPDVVKSWSDLEVAKRWWKLFPQRRDADGNAEKPRKTDLQRANHRGPIIGASLNSC